MTLSHHALILVAFMLAGCAATTPSTPLPEATAFVPPADGFLPVTHVSCGRFSPAWIWRVQVPEGSWKVVCRGTWSEGGFSASAYVGFPDGTKLTLPSDAVTIACRQMSNDPELDAWQDDRGRVLLRIQGLLTALVSEGVFAIDGHRLDGWWSRDMTHYDMRTRKPKVYYEGVFDGDGRQLAP